MDSSRVHRNCVVDYLLVVALDEENQYLLDVLKKTLRVQLRRTPKGPVVAALGKVSHPGGREELLVVVCPGQMGHTGLAAALPMIIDQWRPRDIVLIGISGSFDRKDLKLGDVLVPMRVFGYAQAKVETVRGKLHWKFRTLGERTASGLRTEVRAIASDPRLLRDWEQQCKQAASTERVVTAETARRPPQIHVHENDALATGNIVVASAQFAAELRGRVANVVRAVDMEAGGLFEALAAMDWPATPLIVRGISDYADKRKSALEEKSKQAWRRFAMQNAVRLVALLIRQRALWYADHASISPPYSISLDLHQESLRLCAEAGIRNREIGGRNWAFAPIIHRAAGTPKATIVIQATEVAPESDVKMLAREIFGPYTEIVHRMEPGGKIVIKKPPTDKAFRLDLFYSSSSGAGGLTVGVNDEFGRTLTRSFPSGTGGADHVLRRSGL